MSIMGTAVSGLLAYQRAMATTSHNISNASTEGYSRQRTMLETRSPQVMGGMFIGQGVNISSIERMQSNLIDAQLRTALSSSSNADVRASFAESLDLFLSDDTTGLEPVLESYFNSVQDVASDPTDMSARTVMLNEAETFVERLSQMNALFEEQRTLVNGRIGTTVDEINEYSQTLADLNQQIVSGYTAGSAPNDLLDQRDNILRHLSEKIDVSITEQDDGSVSVFIGNGQSLVSGGVAQELVADNLTADPHNFQIGLKTNVGNTPIDVTRFMSGGEIGALVEVRTELLDRPQNELGLIGLNLATQFNEQNRLGLDLDGAQGGDLFTLPEVKVSASMTNTGSEPPAVAISDVSNLTASDYRLLYDGAGFKLSRLPEGDQIDLTAAETAPGSGVYEVDGMTIDTSAMLAPPATPPASGDDWLIQPTRFAAGALGVAIDDPSQIAAAGAVYAEPSRINQGDARILSAKAVDADALDISDPAMPVVLSFDGANFTATPAGIPDPPTLDYDAVKNIRTLSMNGWEVQIQGTPQAGDEFVVDSNAGNPGDNRNMLAMADIQNLRTVGGKTTIQGTYNSLVSDVGTQTRQAQIARDSSATLLEAAQAQREALSGVSLDEEAADLMRYQQAYQASAQVIAVAGEIFDTLLNAMR